MGNVLKRSSLIKRANPLTVENLGSLLGFLKKWTFARSVQMPVNHDDEFIGPVNYGNSFPEDWFWDTSTGIKFRKYPDDYPDASKAAEESENG